MKLKRKTTKMLSFKPASSSFCHCEEPRRSLCLGGRRGNPEAIVFLEKKYLKSMFCLVYGLLCRFAPRNDFAFNINCLNKIVNVMHEQLKLSPIVGAELEFYFFGNAQNLEKKILNQKNADSFEKERAKNQYEITFSETADILSLIARINNAKEFITAFAKKHKIKASFKSYIKGQEVGSSLQFHISMLNEKKQNVFAKVGENESDYTLYSVGGLLHYMLSHFLLFASSKNSYKRFYEALEAKCFTPLAVCWGADNRTAAVRIPQSTLNPQNRNIEHRVAGSDEEPAKVLYAILLAIYLGIKNKINPPEKVYGKAYEKQYQQAPFNAIMFPKNLKEAKKLFDNEIAFLQN